MSWFESGKRPMGFRFTMTTALSLAMTLSLVVLGASSVLAEESLEALEFRLLGQKFPGKPMEARVAQLERALGQASLPNASLEYRLNRLYSVQAIKVSQQMQQEAVRAYNHGVDEATAGRLETAIEAYRKAIALNPGLIPAYNNLGSILEHLHKYNDAIALYDKALEQDPKNPLLHRNLGILCEKVGNVPKALTEYRQYLKLTPNPDPAIQSIMSQYDSQSMKGKSSPDYYALARSGSQGRSLLWPDRLNPIPVFINLEPDQVPFLTAVREGMQAWENASQGRLRFKEVSHPADARITIRLQEGPLAHPYLDVGHASYDVKEEQDRGRPLLKVAITVNTGERDAPISLEDRLAQVKRLALHEMGHAIGIWGHSSDPGDIMFSRPIASTLSDRDVRTLRRLYSEGDGRLTRN